MPLSLITIKAAKRAPPNRIAGTQLVAGLSDSSPLMLLCWQLFCSSGCYSQEQRRKRSAQLTSAGEMIGLPAHF
jgi:hypothetical protein